MIQCPDCGEFRVHEERHIPIPSGQLTGCAGIISGPSFRVLSYIFVIMFTILVVLGMMGVGSRIPEDAPLRDLGIGCTICIASLTLFLVPFGMAKGLTFIVNRSMSRAPGEGSWPRQYQRTCEVCGFRWTWKPGEPSPSYDPQRASQVQVERRRKATGLPHQKAARKTSPSQPFHCPECSETSYYDPWVEAAACPHCGFVIPRGKRMRSYLQRMRLRAYQPYLEELLAYWQDTDSSDASYRVSSAAEKQRIFREYRRALGEVVDVQAGHFLTGYVRNFTPKSEAINDFVEAYAQLRRGDKAAAAQTLEELTRTSPQFADTWIWLSATTEDPAERLVYLKEAIGFEPAHPLAVNALAVAQGDVTPTGETLEKGQGHVITLARCERCGGTLQYEPGSDEVQCSYCGHSLPLKGTSFTEEPTPRVSTLRLQRHYESRYWEEADRVAHCQACGAELTLTAHLAKQCVYCLSTNVLVEDKEHNLQQPDGFLPFEIDAERASSILGEILHKGRRGRSKSETNRALKENLQGIYVPFWVFDGVVELRMRWLFEDGGLSDGQPERQTFYNLIFPGVNLPPPSYLDQITPFNLSTLVPYSPKLLADWAAQLYNQDVEIVVEDVYDALLTLASSRAGPPIVTDESPAEGARAIRTLQVSDTTYQLLLLPIWISNFSLRDQTGLALVNGQSGQVVISNTPPSRTRDT
jgi:LSD1 subclass zinc finger protein